MRARNWPRVCHGSISPARSSNRCTSIARSPSKAPDDRPDEAYVATVANALICWPTKLALAPDLGDKVIAHLAAPSISSSDADGGFTRRRSPCRRGIADVQYRELGKTGLRVSLLGLGAVAFGRTEGLKYAVAPRLPSMRDLSELLAAARDAGVNLVDTAPAYGVSEERLGELLMGRRDEWVLCTKVGEIFEAGTSRWDFSPEHTRRSVHESLRRLGPIASTSYWFIRTAMTSRSCAISARCTMLAQLKQEGSIRAFGMSHKTIAGGLQAAESATS